jgi:2-phosphoglycerate kinase
MATPPEEQANTIDADDWLPTAYWLGGSPCAGKSSVADRLAERYGLTVYRCDEAYFRHVQVCNPVDHPTLHAITGMSWDEIWMRPVDVQVAAEFAAYREEFAMILHDLRGLPRDRPILVEGCALLPELVAPLSRSQRALWFVPTPAFQRHHYSQRGFIEEILSQCRDPQQAWDNWMSRDEQFGRQVAADARQYSFTVELVDGRRSIEELTVLAAAHFGLESCQ